MKHKSLNPFANHALKFDWIKKFFANPETFLKEYTLSSDQISRFKRFLFDAELVKRKIGNVTLFTSLVKKSE